MSNFVGNPEDRFSHNEAQIQRGYFYSEMHTQAGACRQLLFLKNYSSDKRWQFSVYVITRIRDVAFCHTDYFETANRGFGR